MEELDEVDFFDLDMLGIKRSRALEAYSSLPEELTLSVNGQSWRVNFSVASSDIQRTVLAALPAADREMAHVMQPWHSWANGDDMWMRIYTAPIHPDTEVSVSSRTPIAYSDLSRCVCKRIPPLSLDKYMQRTFSRADGISYERTRVNSPVFQQQMLRMKQVLLLLTGDPKSVDISKFGQKKLDAHKHLWNKITDAVTNNPFNLMVVEDASRLNSLINYAIQLNNGKAEYGLKRIAELRSEFKATGAVKEIEL